MKPIQIYNDKFLDSISWFMKIGGIALFPFIIMRENRKNTERGKITINHETIHFWQTIELGVIVFYLLYLIFYLINVIKYRNNKKAYYNIPFEKEAYNNDKNFNYVNNRKAYAWINYI